METLVMRSIAFALVLLMPTLAPAQEIVLNVISDTLTLRRGDIQSAEAVQREGQWSVEITLGPDAAAKFGDITARNIRKPMQIVVGDRIISTPIILNAIRLGKIAISGNFTEELAKEMAARFR
jgi:preprotein translocase subunit SecD